MVCELFLALGLSVVCTPTPPPRDEVAEFLRDSMAAEQEEEERALAARARLYQNLGSCSDCGVLRTDPFPQKKDR